jgi:methyltransferase (TIGR00027 family)
MQRSKGDGVQGASLTALVIAWGAVVLSKDPKHSHLVSDEDLQISCNALKQTKTGPLLLPFTGRRALPLFEMMDRVVSPGMLLHFRLRKFLISKWVKVALAEGVEQVVVLGAGYDGLAYQLHKIYPDRHFFEVDAASTAELKRECLPADIDKNLHLVSGDLSKRPVADYLAETSFDGEKSTVYIVEGLSMYLTELEVSKLLVSIVKCSLDAKLIMTYMDQVSFSGTRFNRLRAKFVHSWLNYIKEPLKWGSAPESVSDFLAVAGFQLLADEIPTEQQEFKDIVNYVMPSERVLLATSIRE